VPRNRSRIAIAQEGGRLDQMNLQARVCEIQCGLESGYAAADDKCAFAH
jgi:hypothetical protein